MEAQTTVSNSTQCGLFIGEYKKYTVSGVTFSFKSETWCPNQLAMLLQTLVVHLLFSLSLSAPTVVGVDKYMWVLAMSHMR